MEHRPDWPPTLRRGIYVAMMLGGVVFLSRVWGQGQAPAAAQSGYAGSDTCTTCHEDEGRRFKNTVMGKAFAHPRTSGEEWGCESCHGPGKAHADSGPYQNDSGQLSVASSFEAASDSENYPGVSLFVPEAAFPVPYDQVSWRLVVYVDGKPVYQSPIGPLVTANP